MVQRPGYKYGETNMYSENFKQLRHCDKIDKKASKFLIYYNRMIINYILLYYSIIRPKMIHQ